MAIKALDRTLMNRMGRTRAKLRHHGRMTACAVVLGFVLDEKLVFIFVYSMATGTIKPGTSVRIGSDHRGLVFSLMAARANICLRRK